MSCMLTKGSVYYRSTRNTRIERQWVEVGTQFCRAWRAFFYRLEEEHQLERGNAQHLWLLHYLFLDMINDDCQVFVQHWNNHPLSKLGHKQSPEVSNLLPAVSLALADFCGKDIRFMGMQENGVYVEDLPDVDVQHLNDHYGTHGRPRGDDGSNGAGLLQDEDIPALPIGDSNIDDEYESDGKEDFVDIEEPYLENFNIRSVPVPKHASPFRSDDDHTLFEEAFSAVYESKIVPAGYGVLQEEWAGLEYASQYMIKSNRRGVKEIQVSIPKAVWLPRAALWAQGLDVMRRVLHLSEGEQNLDNQE